MRRWPLALLIAAGCVGLRLASLMFSPTVYECRALIALPEFPEGSRFHMSVDEIGISHGLINVAETKQLIAAYWDELRAGKVTAALDRSSIGRINGINVENVVGTEVFFVLSIKTTGDPAPGPIIAEDILGYLQANDFVKCRYEQERSNLARLLEETEKIVTSATAAAKRAPGRSFSAVDQDTRLADLNYRIYRLRNGLISTHTFEFVKKPITVAVPLRRRLVVDAVAFSVIGLVAGLAAAMLLERLRVPGRGGEAAVRSS